LFFAKIERLIDHKETIHIKLARGKKTRNTIFRLAVEKYKKTLSKEARNKCQTMPTKFPAISNMTLRLTVPSKGNSKKTKRKLKKQMETKALMSSELINSKHVNNVTKETIKPTNT